MDEAVLFLLCFVMMGVQRNLSGTWKLQREQAYYLHVFVDTFKLEDAIQ